MLRGPVHVYPAKLRQNGDLAMPVRLSVKLPHWDLNPDLRISFKIHFIKVPRTNQIIRWGIFKRIYGPRLSFSKPSTTKTDLRIIITPFQISRRIGTKPCEVFDLTERIRCCASFQFYLLYTHKPESSEKKGKKKDKKNRESSTRTNTTTIET